MVESSERSFEDVGELIFVASYQLPVIGKIWNFLFIAGNWQLETKKPQLFVNLAL